MEKTWKSTVAGILDIISGATGFLVGLVLVIVGLVWGYFTIAGPKGLFIPPMIFWIVGSVSIIFGVIAVVGGVYALQRKVWVLALAGSIFAFSCCRPLGIATIVLTALSKHEFE